MRLGKAAAAAALVALCGLPAAAGDGPYPKGTSSHVFDERDYTIRMPEPFDAEQEYSLVVLIDGSSSAIEKLDADRYVICHPSRKFDGLWAGSAIGDIRDLVAHVRKRVKLPDHRVHVIGANQGIHDILTMLAFGKKSPFATATYLDSSFFGGSVAKRAKKGMAVLAYGAGDATGRDKGIVELLTGKVRSVEAREEEGDVLNLPYFRWWLRTMEGDVTPGDDLSLHWAEGTATAAEVDAHRKKATDGMIPALLYFFDPADKGKPEATEIQRVTFHQPEFRGLARNCQSIKLDRTAHADLFASFGLTATPAVVILDHTGAVHAKQEGKVKPKPLVKALGKAVTLGQKAEKKARKGK